MKILTISNCPLRESEGSGYVVVNFCRGLQQRGHEVDAFGPESYEPLQFMGGRAKSYRQAIGMVFFCLHQVKNKRYDVIEFYGGESWLISYMLKIKKGRSFLIVSHSNGLETHVRKAMAEWASADLKSPENTNKWYQINQDFLFVNAFKKADKIVTVSEFDKKYALCNEYKESSSIVAINNSLPDSYLNLEVDFYRSQKKIGYCGSWIERKGIATIRSDISQILKVFPECKFQLIGVGNEFRKEKYFSQELCAQIEFIPFVKDKNTLKQIYQSFSIFIMPSIYESFGLVAAEAMACGCALVAHQTGFADSLKHKEEAILIGKPLSPYLYEGVRELLLDEDLRLKIAKAGYVRVQRLRWDLALDKLEKTYTEWLK
jgi:glycosyltransferase involved in cell wall biosynthesis